MNTDIGRRDNHPLNQFGMLFINILQNCFFLEVYWNWHIKSVLCWVLHKTTVKTAWNLMC